MGTHLELTGTHKGKYSYGLKGGETWQEDY